MRPLDDMHCVVCGKRLDTSMPRLEILKKVYTERVRIRTLCKGSFSDYCSFADVDDIPEIYVKETARERILFCLDCYNNQFERIYCEL